MSAYTDFDKTKNMSFLMKGNEVLEKYNEIWKKIINSIKKESDRESVYNEKYLKIKVKPQKKVLNLFVYQ